MPILVDPLAMLSTVGLGACLGTVAFARACTFDDAADSCLDRRRVTVFGVNDEDVDAPGSSGPSASLSDGNAYAGVDDWCGSDSLPKES